MGNLLEDASRAAGNVATQAAPWVERLARVGFAANALTYIVIGALAAQAAAGRGGRMTDMRGAFRAVLERPFGRGVLIVLAVGFFGYAIWALVEAVVDPERRGTTPKGIALRIGDVGSALIHGALGLAALHLARGGVGGGDNTEQLTARALALPYGEWLVVAAGAGVICFGLYELYLAFTAQVSDHLDLHALSAEAERWALRVSRFGIAARGIVFGIGGGHLIRAALRHDPSEAADLGDSLRAVRSGQYGDWLLGVVAAGLIAYGIYQLVHARYRRITPAA